MIDEFVVIVYTTWYSHFRWQCIPRKGYRSNLHRGSKIQSDHTYCSMKMGRDHSNKAFLWKCTCFQECTFLGVEVRHWPCIDKKDCCDNFQIVHSSSRKYRYKTHRKQCHRNDGQIVSRCKDLLWSSLAWVVPNLYHPKTLVVRWHRLRNANKLKIKINIK